MGYELRLPEAAVFAGELAFVEATVEIDEDKLGEVFVEFCDSLIDMWLRNDVSDVDNQFPVVVNGKKCVGEIANINFTGELIIAMVGDIKEAFGEEEGTYFYVKTRHPGRYEDRTVPIQGVMIHRGDWHDLEPVQMSNVDAIRAFEYVEEV